MMVKWKYNPKTNGSGIITCIPQKGTCPIKCDDCFFQSGRSYLEPLEDNLPHIPSVDLAEGRIVRMNDGNDSNNQRDLVMVTAKKYKDYFYNTSIPKNLDGFDAPVVLTINPKLLTDNNFYKVEKSPNLMFVRVRTNMWNIHDVVTPAVEYYSNIEVPIVLTFMAYYLQQIPTDFETCYEYKVRTINSYYVLKREFMDLIMGNYSLNPYVYSCGYKGVHSCKFCGNCIREYYNTKERIRNV